MATGEFLLDTNLVIALQGSESEVVYRAQQGAIYINATVVGELYFGAFKSGRPAANIWIAASARQYDLTLVTRDSHFARVPDLRTEKW